MALYIENHKKLRTIFVNLITRTMVNFDTKNLPILHCSICILMMSMKRGTCRRCPRMGSSPASSCTGTQYPRWKETHQQTNQNTRDFNTIGQRSYQYKKSYDMCWSTILNNWNCIWCHIPSEFGIFSVNIKT